MKILIYGAGVIGSLFAVLFSEAGYRHKKLTSDTSKLDRRKPQRVSPYLGRFAPSIAAIRRIKPQKNTISSKLGWCFKKTSGFEPRNLGRYGALDRGHSPYKIKKEPFSPSKLGRTSLF